VAQNVRFRRRSGNWGNARCGSALDRAGEGKPDTWWRPHCEANAQARAGESRGGLVEHLTEGLGGVRSMRIALGLISNHLDDVGQMLAFRGKLDDGPLVEVSDFDALGNVAAFRTGGFARPAAEKFGGAWLACFLVMAREMFSPRKIPVGLCFVTLMLCCSPRTLADCCLPSR
jgi:hypothetical protein